MRTFFSLQIKSHYKVWPQLLAVIAVRNAICRVWWGYSGSAAASVARVAAQQAGYFENSRRENYRAMGCGVLGDFYNVPRPPKVYVDK